MTNKEKIDDLLLDIRELETSVSGMREAEIYPVSFFGRTFDLTHKILKDLHSIEAAQLELLRIQMEEHEALIRSIPPTAAAPMPEKAEQSRDKTEEVPPVKEKPLTAAPKPDPEEPETKNTRSQAQTEVEEPETRPQTVHEKPVATRTEPAGTSSEHTGLFLNDLLEKKNLSDFRKAFSLNDRFRFRRELFGGDENRMIKAINDLNALSSYEDSVAYLNEELKWNMEDEAVADFIKLLEKRFR